MKAVEVEVRRVAALPNELVGVALMRKALSPKDGALRHPGAAGGEQQAAEVIQLADVLVRIVQRDARLRP